MLPAALKEEIWRRRCRLSLFLARMRIRGQAAITVIGRDDGIGAQIRAIYSTIVLSRMLGIKYLHTPLQSVAHNYDRLPSWEQDWESFFGLGQLPTVDMLQIRRPSLKPCTNLHEALAVCSNELYVTRTSQWLTEWMPSTMENAAPYFRELYCSSAKGERSWQCEPFGPGSCLNIAVHIRRGDVTPDRHDVADRYTSNDVYVTALTRLSQLCVELGVVPTFDIFSQGTKDDFAVFDSFKPALFLNHCAMDTFSRLTQADVLLTARSSFSFVAGVLNPNVVLFGERQDGPLPSWISINDNAKIKSAIKGYLDK